MKALRLAGQGSKVKSEKGVIRYKYGEPSSLDSDILCSVLTGLRYMYTYIPGEGPIRLTLSIKGLYLPP